MTFSSMFSMLQNGLFLNLLPRVFTLPLDQKSGAVVG
jgi:hypothetical protein